MSALRHRERRNDVHKWVETFLKATGTSSVGDMDGNVMEPLTIAHFEKWLASMLFILELLWTILSHFYSSTIIYISEVVHYIAFSV